VSTKRSHLSVAVVATVAFLDVVGRCTLSVETRASVSKSRSWCRNRDAVAERARRDETVRRRPHRITSLAGAPVASIHTEVSTRTTGALPPAFYGRVVASDRRQVPLPQSGPGETEDLPGSGAADELVEGALDGAGVRSLPAHAEGGVEELLIEHKICTFHAHRVQEGGQPISGGRHPTRCGERCCRMGGLRTKLDGRAGLQRSLRILAEAH
jgi:hypothetical protein